MFWESILQGTKIMFFHWEIWVASLFYILFSVSLNKAIKVGKNYLIQGIAAPLILGIATSFMIASILPILCGGENFTPLSLLIGSWWTTLKIGIFASLVLMAIMFLGWFIPISIFANSKTFIQGAIVFIILMNKSLAASSGSEGSKVNVFPGFWLSIGFLLFSILLTWFVHFLFFQLIVPPKLIEEDKVDEVSIISSSIISVITGILVLSIYVSYIRLTVVSFSVIG